MIHSPAKVLSISNNHFVHRHDKNFGIKFNLSSTKIWSSLIKYSGDLKADPSKTGNIPKPDFLKISFQMVITKMIYHRYLWCSFWQPHCIYHWKFGLKSLDFKRLIQNGCQKVRISNGQSKMAAKNTIVRHVCPVFKWHLWTDLLSTIRNPDTFRFQIPTVLQLKKSTF